MAEQNPAGENLRKVLEACATVPNNYNYVVDAMRAAVLLDALDNPDVNSIEFYQLATKILGPGAGKLPPAK